MICLPSSPTTSFRVKDRKNNDTVAANSPRQKFTAVAFFHGVLRGLLFLNLDRSAVTLDTLIVARFNQGSTCLHLCMYSSARHKDCIRSFLQYLLRHRYSESIGLERQVPGHGSHEKVDYRPLVQTKECIQRSKIMPHVVFFSGFNMLRAAFLVESDD
jgi:hypothetical protein